MFRFKDNHGRVLTMAFVSLALFACGGGGGKKVYFGNLEDGSNVESPFKVSMKAENLIVEPATLGVTEGHGHFHIIVDAQLASPSAPMVKDEKHIHYGNGESEAVVDLPVGQHTLILQFAKGDHVPYDPPLYQQIQINVIKQNVADTAAVAKPADSTAAATGAATAATAADSATRLPSADTSKTAKKTVIAENKKADSAKAEAQKHEGHKKESKAH
jgi:hypothetical protein